MKHVIKHVESTPEVVKDDPYRTVNVLHAARWAVDAWKHGVKPSTLVHCFQRSKVKVHGPAPMDVDTGLAEVEEEIYDCIRVAYPGFQRASLSEFIDSVEVVQNSVEEEEQRILDTYEPILLQDSDSDPEGMQDVPIRLHLKVLKPCVSFAFKTLM